MRCRDLPLAALVGAGWRVVRALAGRTEAGADEAVIDSRGNPALVVEGVVDGLGEGSVEHVDLDSEGFQAGGGDFVEACPRVVT